VEGIKVEGTGVDGVIMDGVSVVGVIVDGVSVVGVIVDGVSVVGVIVDGVSVDGVSVVGVIGVGKRSIQPEEFPFSIATHCPIMIELVKLLFAYKQFERVAL
jgi:hypothetical protein